jgi:hypothetical protein
VRDQESGTYSLLDLARIGFSGATSILINKSAVAKYAGMLSDQWSRELPIDLDIRDIVQRNERKAYVVVLFPTSVSPANTLSDIRRRFDQSHRFATFFAAPFLRRQTSRLCMPRWMN